MFQKEHNHRTKYFYFKITDFKDIKFRYLYFKLKRPKLLTLENKRIKLH